MNISFQILSQFIIMVIFPSNFMIRAVEDRPYTDKPTARWDAQTKSPTENCISKKFKFVDVSCF
jgi:hypothetical protein